MLANPQHVRRIICCEEKGFTPPFLPGYSSSTNTWSLKAQSARWLTCTGARNVPDPCCPAGDMLTRCFPNSGRILAAQFSVLCTFPCTVLIFRLLPMTSGAGMNSLVLPYGFSLLCSGLLISWCVQSPNPNE